MNIDEIKKKVCDRYEQKYKYRIIEPKDLDFFSTYDRKYMGYLEFYFNVTSVGPLLNSTLTHIELNESRKNEKD